VPARERCFGLESLPPPFKECAPIAPEKTTAVPYRFASGPPSLKFAHVNTLVAFDVKHFRTHSELEQLDITVLNALPVYALPVYVNRKRVKFWPR